MSHRLLYRSERSLVIDALASLGIWEKQTTVLLEGKQSTQPEQHEKVACYTSCTPSSKLATANRCTDGCEKRHRIINCDERNTQNPATTPIPPTMFCQRQTLAPKQTNTTVLRSTTYSCSYSETREEHFFSQLKIERSGWANEHTAPKQTNTRPRSLDCSSARGALDGHKHDVAKRSRAHEHSTAAVAAATALSSTRATLYSSSTRTLVVVVVPLRTAREALERISISSNSTRSSSTVHVCS